MAKKVTTIPATLNRFDSSPIAVAKKRKTAGYARVSTDSEEQATSYEAQVDYYTRYINGREDWEFAGVYTDEGISATNTKKRDGFNQMIEDALAGKIDLIITKSVSRFARNTVDSLTTVRKLKEKGIEVYFEKENIYTLDTKGELLITIMSSLAQEESRSISENTTWGKRKQFADGKGSLAYSTFLGYEKGEDGSLRVNPEQAETVKLIYQLFLQGLSPYAIGKKLTRLGINRPAKKLTGLGIKSPAGKDTWHQSSVKSILTNEKYKGDALLQKQYTADFLTKKRKRNQGEIPQYYVEGNHEAIIPPETWELVQEEMERRKSMGARYSSTSIFSSKIKCSECGNWYGSKVWHSQDKYRRVIFQCNRKFKNDKKCRTPHLTEDEIKDAFVKAVNAVIPEKDELIANTKVMMRTLCDTTELEVEQSRFQTETRTVAEMVKRIVAENKAEAMDQEEYQRRRNELVARYEAARDGYEKASGEISDRQGKRKTYMRFIGGLQKLDGFCGKFDEELWTALLDYATVYARDDIRFTFKAGNEVKVDG